MTIYRSIEYNLKHSKSHMRSQSSQVAILILATMASLSAGNVIHVPGDQPTIQAGIGAATNGDTVLVAAGIYYENINFNGKAITGVTEIFDESGLYYYIALEDEKNIWNVKLSQVEVVEVTRFRKV